MENRIYGLVIGGAIGDTLGSIVAYAPHITVTSPYDAEHVNIKPGYWTEPTTLWCYAASDQSRQIEEYSCTEMFSLNSSPCVTRGRRCACIPLVQASAMVLKHFGNYQDVLQEASNLGTCKRCAQASKLFASIIDSTLHGRTKREILHPKYYSNLEMSEEIQELLLDPHFDESIDYFLDSNDVVHALRIVLYCFKTTNNYTEGLHLIVNNSVAPAWTGALYGQLAGAFYGLTDINETWMDVLQGSEQLLNAGDSYVKAVMETEKEEEEAEWGSPA